MSEELLIRHCSPTLAGLKTGSLFSCQYESEEQLLGRIRSLNKRLVCRGLRITPLKMGRGWALIYVYRPAKLRSDISREDAASILCERGYCCSAPERCVAELMSKLRGQPDFPHEIGLFLGYPPEDVRGFIENKSKDCKCVGCWKVYGDEENARKIFAKYKKCTESYIRCLANGTSIERLTVFSR